MSLPKILVVDANASNLYLTAEVLRGDDLDVDVAGSAELAQFMIRANRPDVVLTDLVLPGLDGLGLARRLKADPGTRGITVIAVSSDAARHGEALRAGCSGFLDKPIDIQTFAACVVAISSEASAR